MFRGAEADDYDILIRGGSLFDGSGSAAKRADLAIRGGRIAAIGDLAGAHARKTIDAAGLALAPGFIDIKTHSDFTLPINPKAESKVRQGVTTEIVGHCGFSVAPCLPGRVELLRDYLSPSAPWLPFRQMSFREYLDGFPPASVNAGMLVGHNTLRLMVMGMERRPPSREELARMTELLEEALDAGALGMSSGLFTSPGSYAEPGEMLALASVLKRYNGGYFTHLRDESSGLVEALEEAIEVGERCGVHVEIVHFKCSGTDNWGKVAQVLAMVEAARGRGVDIDLDSYPYTAGSNPLKNILPQWVQTGGVEAMLERLRSAEARERVRKEIAANGLNNWGRIPDWDCIRISISPGHAADCGRTIGDIASERGSDPIDVLCDFLVEDRGATRVLVTSISEDDVRALVAAPRVLVGSDGNCVATYGVVSQGMPHPRFYGTFPRIIGRYVREKKVLPLETAIHKMAGGPAKALRLRDRGLLREGLRADAVLFDPADFTDRATYDHPHQYPSGGRTTVIVNGTIVVEDATHTGSTPGAVLRRRLDGTVD
jgi:N-acyl-D-amino-acid deacylase